jgi:hypothetical protein
MEMVHLTTKLFKVPFEEYRKTEAGIMYIKAKSREEAIQKAKEDNFDDIEINDQDDFHIKIIEEEIEIEE